MPVLPQGRDRESYDAMGRRDSRRVLAIVVRARAARAVGAAAT
jgi:hypothetical protein